MRVSTEKLHICTEKRLSVTEQRQYSTEKFDFHGITTRLYGEGARFYGEGLALMGHRTLMLAETIDAGLLHTAAERKNDQQILMQIQGKDCVALEVCYHKVCYCNSTIFLTRETKKQSETERSTSVYEKSYDVFCKKVIEMEVIGNKQKKYMKDLLEKFVIIAKDTENVVHLNIELLNSSYD